MGSGQGVAGNEKLCEIRETGVSSKRNFQCLEEASAIQETHSLELQKALLLQLYGDCYMTR